VAVRERMEAIGQVSAELLHDLQDALFALEQRTRLAAGEARMGRAPAGELDRAVEDCADVRLMVRDVVEVTRGAALSPEVVFDPCAAVERAVRRFLPTSRAVEVRMTADLPPGTVVPGRESFMARLAGHLLAGAARRSQGHVLVELRLDSHGSGIVLSVADDGEAPRHGAPAPHPRPSPEDGWRPGIVAWLVAQLGGEVRCRPARAPGGSGLDIRLPAIVP
jgi:signal transduction histidine kinase